MSRDSRVRTFQVDRGERCDPYGTVGDTDRVTGESHKPPHPCGKTRPKGDGMSLEKVCQTLGEIKANPRSEVFIEVKGEFYKIARIEGLQDGVTNEGNSSSSSVMIVGA
jgi:hypothetical protein